MKTVPTAFCDLPADLYPLTIEAFNPKSKAIVWMTTIQRPPHGEKIAVKIPPLRYQFGHPVSMRVRFADGSIEEQGPVYEQ